MLRQILVIRPEHLIPRVFKLGKQLGLTDAEQKNLERCDGGNWQECLKSIGVETWNERFRINDRKDPKFQDLHLAAPGAQICVLSMDKEGVLHILVQIRKDFKKLGVPGGASDMWGRGKNLVLEDPVITAYREFEEEVGIRFPYPIYYLGNWTTTNHYEIHPDAHAASTYYIAMVQWEYMEELKRAPGSAEGKVMVIPVSKLPEYDWFEDAEEAFERIMEMFGLNGKSGGWTEPC